MRVENIEYQSVDPRQPTKHMLDLYLPEEGDKGVLPPLIVWVHGGAWVHRNKGT